MKKICKIYLFLISCMLVLTACAKTVDPTEQSSIINLDEDSISNQEVEEFWEVYCILLENDLEMIKDNSEFGKEIKEYQIQQIEEQMSYNDEEKRHMFLLKKVIRSEVENTPHLKELMDGMKQMVEDDIREIKYADANGEDNGFQDIVQQIRVLAEQKDITTEQYIDQIFYPNYILKSYEDVLVWQYESEHPYPEQINIDTFKEYNDEYKRYLENIYNERISLREEI